VEVPGCRFLEVMAVMLYSRVLMAARREGGVGRMRN